jgi:molecular chaperone HscB
MNDPFATLGIEPRFDIDLALVEQRHRDLSRALHPDRYSGAPPAERRLALGRAIEVNEALRLMRDPIRRAEALMRRAGVRVGETEEPKANPELLMEVMESREALSDAARKKDAAALKRLEEAMRAREAAVLAALARGFDAGGGDAAKLGELLPSLGELRYIRRFLDEVSAIEEELFA